MLIVCPNCATSYDIDAATLSPNGRQVRCVRCRNVWLAEPSQADKLLAAAAAIGPGREAEAGDAMPGMETISQSADELASEGIAAGQSPISESLESSQVDDLDSEAAADLPDHGADAEQDGPADVEAPSIAPSGLDDVELPAVAARRVDEERSENVEVAAARRQRRPDKRSILGWPLSGLQTAILVLALIDTILIGWRGDVVRALPQTASFYALLGLPVNLRGLTFDGVATSMEQHEGVPILVVDGNVYNGTRKTTEVPRLKFVVRNAAHEEIYAWTAVPARALLEPGEAIPFRSRLASPPAEARDLIVRFVNRRDVVAASH